MSISKSESIKETKQRVETTLNAIDNLIATIQDEGDEISGKNGLPKTFGQKLVGKDDTEEENPLQEIKDARIDAIADIKSYRADALGDIKVERATSLVAIGARSEGVIETIFGALAHALAAIQRATAEMDRKRMGYGNPNNQDDH
jgi:hypothetical protein